MKKGIVISILAILMLTLFSANLTQAVDPNISMQPQLIQDHDMKPADPPPESHPTAHQYTAPVTNAANAYDNNEETYSLTNVTQQPYPSLYCRPTANSGNATVSGSASAYDMNPATFASITIDALPPAMKQFSVTTFNSTGITAVTYVDLRINYALTIITGNCSYKIVLYVGAGSLVLVDRIWTTTSTTDPTLGVWAGVTEPNDGIWSAADVANLRISFETQEEIKQDDGIFKVYEVWAYVYPSTVRYFSLRTFSPTAISSYSYLNVVMNYSAVLGQSAYRILVSAGSANTTVQDWVDVSQIDPAVVTWEHVIEPNDGWWSQADLSNAQIIIETRKTEPLFNNGEICVYEAWVTIDPPTINSYPTTYTGGATNPANAYDKNQMSYATMTGPTTTAWVYFTVTTFNVTTLTNYATINLRLKYNFTAWNCQYRIYLQVGSITLDLVPQTTANQTTPVLRTWIGICEPNDGAWSLSDLTNLQVRVAARRTSATGSYSFGFREYETWVTIPDDSFTVRVDVSGIVSSAQLYAWQFNITFNPSVVQAILVSEGPFLEQTYTASLATVTISNTVGWVFAGCALDDWWYGGAEGSGTLATITFQVIAKGNSMFNFTETLLRSFDEVNEIPVPLAHTRSPGWFQYLLGDVNGDAKVDVYDLRQLGKAYGTTSGNPSYDADADQDKDADVDGVDLTTVSSHYGDT